MTSELGRTYLTGLGARFRAAHLVEQASYTLELAESDRTALVRLLPQGYLEEVKRVAGSVLAAISHADFARGEGRSAAGADSASVRSARSWRRTVARRGVRARLLGRDVPDVLHRLVEVDPPAAVAAQVTAMLAWLEAEPELMPGDDIRQLIKDGKAIAARLAAERVSEWQGRVTEMPAKDQRICEEKGALFIGLKVINDAAQELHARDRAAAGRYNLAILSRRIASGKP